MAELEEMAADNMDTSTDRGSRHDAAARVSPSCSL